MSAVVKGSVALAVAVALVSIVIGATGLHENPVASGLGSIVLFIVFNVGAVVWVLKQTAQDNGYGRQVLNGLGVGVMAGALIFVLSWLTLAVIFPNYLDEMKEGYIAWMESSGVPQERVEAQIAQMDATTPISQSFAGTIGTVVTSVLVAAVAAVFLRRK